MQVCTTLQTDSHASIPYRPDALPATQPTASEQIFKYMCIIIHPANSVVVVVVDVVYVFVLFVAQMMST